MPARSPVGGSAGAGVHLLEVDRDRHFRINDVVPGDYRIHILVQRATGDRIRTAQSVEPTFTMPDIPGGVSDVPLVIPGHRARGRGRISQRRLGRCCAGVYAAEQPGPRATPYTAIRWDSSMPQVTVNGTWYELNAIDGVPAVKIVQFLQRSGDEQWQKHFGEDLVEAMVGMGHQPGNTVNLQLTTLDTHQPVTMQNVPMTPEKSAGNCG